MSNDTAGKDPNAVATTTTAPQAEPVVEENPYESEARDQGWVSKEEWQAEGKDANDWRPAKEFVERGEIFKTLHQVKRELKQEKAAREALQRHHQMVYDSAKRDAYNKLKLEKRQAMRNEDFEKVEEIEDQMEAIQKERVQTNQQLTQATQQAAQANGVPVEFQEWVNKNPWYNSDSEMREFSEAVGYIYIQKNPQAAPSEVLKHVEAKVRKQFSEKFGRRASPNAVAGVDRTNQRRTSTNELVMDEMEIQIMKTLVSNGDMTEEQYKAELKKAKGL